MEKQDFYQSLRHKIRNWLTSKEGAASEWAEYIMLAPDLFYLLWKLSGDPKVAASEKAKLAAAIAYFISPIDFIPEALVGPIGYADDIALAAYVLNGVVNKTDPEIIRKYWQGEGDVLLVIKKILVIADKMVGSGLWSKLKKNV